MAGTESVMPYSLPGKLSGPAGVTGAGKIGPADRTDGAHGLILFAISLIISSSARVSRITSSLIFL